MGRRKIPMEKIEDKSKTQVAFSKRRQGLFKKAMDLCVLSSAQVAIIAFSPGGRPYSMGHTSVETVINHYLNGTIPNIEDSTMLHCLKEIDTKSKILQNMEQCNQQGGFWWENMQVEETDSLDELEMLRTGLEQVRENVSTRRGELELSKGFTCIDQPDTLDEDHVEDLSLDGGFSIPARDGIADNLPPLDSPLKY